MFFHLVSHICYQFDSISIISQVFNLILRGGFGIISAMSTITTDDVLDLAQLSNIQLGDAEAESLKKDLQEILAYVDMLGELDTAGVEPTYQVNGKKNVFRPDVVDAGAVTREALLAIAPEQLDNQVKVPKVL